MSFLTPLLLHKIHASQAEIVKSTGRSFRLHQTGVSSAAAVAVMGLGVPTASATAFGRTCAGSSLKASDS
ncbi:hypothetical protein WJX77_001800 [Trebouxia sp. C0004]